MKTTLSLASLLFALSALGCSADNTGSMPIDPTGGCGTGNKMCGGMCVTSDLAHGCGTADACDPCPAGANGTPACVAGSCGYQCNVGFGDCDGNAANGCEKDVTSDAANCGSCGFTCAGTCSQGACQIVTPGNGSDQACLTIDAGNIYWATANLNPGAVYSVPKAGGSPKQIATGLMSPRGIAVDASNVYFTTLGGGQIVKCPLSGCQAPLPTLATGQNQPYAIAVDATHVYWVNRQPAGNGTVMKCAITGCGGNPTQLASGQATPFDIAVDANFVYWSNFGDGTIRKVPLAGGTPVQVTTAGQMGTRGIAVDGSNLYYAHSTLGTISQVPLAGGATVTLASTQVSPWAVTVNGGEVFWSNSRATAAGGAVQKTAIGGGPIIPRAINQNFPLCVAADATTLYWINAGGNSVQKVAR